MKSACCIWLLIALAGCESQPASVTLTDASMVDGAAKDAAALRSDLPGLVLWLAPGLGLVPVGPKADEWIDQTVHKHRLYSDVPELSPQIVEDVHGKGLRFQGKGRLAMANDSPPEAKAALALLLDDFFIAVVAKPEPVADQHRQVLWALGTHHSPQQENIVAPELVAKMTVGSQLEAGVSPMGKMASHLLAPGVSLDEVHLYVLRAVGSSLEMRVDGNVVSSSPRNTDAQTGAVASIPFQPLHIGNWDYDQTGFRGTIYEVVVIRGHEPIQKSSAIERGLLEKYRR